MWEYSDMVMEIKSNNLMYKVSLGPYRQTTKRGGGRSLVCTARGGHRDGGVGWMGGGASEVLRDRQMFLEVVIV